MFKRLFFVLSILALSALLFQGAAAQEQTPLTIAVNKNFGYNDFSGRIQGSFTVRAEGPQDLSRVVFLIDGETLAEVTQPTRWLLVVPNEAAAWRRAEAQVQGLFGSLEDQGAFAGRPAGERWFVVCDERLNRDAERGLGVVNLVFGFVAARPGDYHAFLLSHRPGGSRVHPVAMRRLLASGYCPELLVDASVPPAP